MANIKYFDAADRATKLACKRIRLTPAQKKALTEYNFRLAREDNFLGSVFVTEALASEYAAKVKTAYDACKALGMGPEHGL